MGEVMGHTCLVQCLTHEAGLVFIDGFSQPEVRLLYSEGIRPYYGFPKWVP